MIEIVRKNNLPQFKIFPKVHKEGNPGRLVISSIDCHTTKISKYIDLQLQHPYNHGCTFPIHKYSKQGKN